MEKQKNGERMENNCITAGVCSAIMSAISLLAVFYVKKNPHYYYSVTNSKKILTYYERHNLEIFSVMQHALCFTNSTLTSSIHASLKNILIAPSKKDRCNFTKNDNNNDKLFIYYLVIVLLKVMRRR